MKISEKEAENLLTKGIQKIESDVKRRIPKYDSYPRYIQMAIMNASYRGDLGPATIKLINQGAWNKVSKEYLNHPNYINPGNLRGVVKRMKSNADAFNRYAKELDTKKSAGHWSDRSRPEYRQCGSLSLRDQPDSAASENLWGKICFTTCNASKPGRAGGCDGR